MLKVHSVSKVSVLVVSICLLSVGFAFADSHEILSNKITIGYGAYENKTEPVQTENKTETEPIEPVQTENKTETEPIEPVQTENKTETEPIEPETSKSSTASSGGSGVTMSPKVCGLELCDDIRPVESSGIIFRDVETPKAVITETNEIVTIPSQQIIDNRPIPTIPEPMPTEPIPDMITSPEPIIDPPVDSNGEPLSIFDLFIAWLISIWNAITGQS